MHEELQANERSPLDFIHYGISFAGFIASISGVVVSSVTLAVAGLALMFIGVAYFATAGE